MKKIVYLIYILCTFTMLCCCTSSKQIAVNNAGYFSKDAEHLVVHTPNKVFELHQFKFKYLTLEGQFLELQKKRKNTVHVYIGSEIQPDLSGNVVIDKSAINKIIYETIKVPWALIIGVASLTLIIIGIHSGAGAVNLSG